MTGNHFDSQLGMTAARSGVHSGESTFAKDFLAQLVPVNSLFLHK